MTVDAQDSHAVQGLAAPPFIVSVVAFQPSQLFRDAASFAAMKGDLQAYGAEQQPVGLVGMP